MNIYKWAKRNKYLPVHFNFENEEENEKLDNEKWKNIREVLGEQWKPGRIITSGDGKTQYVINHKGCRERITPKPLSKRARRRNKNICV